MYYLYSFFLPICYFKVILRLVLEFLTNKEKRKLENVYDGCRILICIIKNNLKINTVASLKSFKN